MNVWYIWVSTLESIVAHGFPSISTRILFQLYATTLVLLCNISTLAFCTVHGRRATNHSETVLRLSTSNWARALKFLIACIE